MEAKLLRATAFYRSKTIISPALPGSHPSPLTIDVLKHCSFRFPTIQGIKEWQFRSVQAVANFSWVGRYNSPDEHPFFPNEVPHPCCHPLQYPQDKNKLMELLTYPTVEEAIKNRVEVKTRTYGQEVTINAGGSKGDPVYKINPSLVAELYGDWIMPLTKEVQVQYLLRRLD
nr:Chorismate mutase 1, chloroplastic [Ipomoea batatas]